MVNPRTYDRQATGSGDGVGTFCRRGEKSCDILKHRAGGESDLSVCYRKCLKVGTVGKSLMQKDFNTGHYLFNGGQVGTVGSD